MRIERDGAPYIARRAASVADRPERERAYMAVSFGRKQPGGMVIRKTAAVRRRIIRYAASAVGMQKKAPPARSRQGDRDTTFH